MCGLVVWARVLGASGGGFDSPDGERKQWRRVPSSTKPSAVMFHMFCVLETLGRVSCHTAGHPPTWRIHAHTEIIYPPTWRPRAHPEVSPKQQCAACTATNVPMSLQFPMKL